MMNADARSPPAPQRREDAAPDVLRETGPDALKQTDPRSKNSVVNVKYGHGFVVPGARPVRSRLVWSGVVWSRLVWRSLSITDYAH